MLDSGIPAKISTPFANSGVNRNTVPVASQIGITAGAASYTDGFPPLCFTPLASGGVPPFGADFNGVLYAITAIQNWECAGGMFPYDATFEGIIGGYPKGALLAKSGFNGYWQNLVDGNTTNPDTGGAGWTDAGAGRLLNIQVFTTSGTYNPSSAAVNSIIGRVQGAGGAGGGAGATSASQVSYGGGGAGGAYTEGRFTSGFTGGIPVTVGAGGTAATGAAGGSGGQSSLGALLVANGGAGGPYSAPTTAFPATSINGTVATVPTPGNISAVPGQSSTVGFIASSTSGYAGAGGSSKEGVGGPSGTASGTAGNNGQGKGSGGSGCINLASIATGNIGGSGMPGLVVIFEYS